MNFKIPKAFYLHGQRIVVNGVDHIGAENGTLGEARIAKNEIVLQNNSNGYARSASQIEQTFLHELVHFILSHMDQEELCGEEKFVNGFASLLHQAMVTMEYTAEKSKGGKKRG